VGTFTGEGTFTRHHGNPLTHHHHVHRQHQDSSFLQSISLNRSGATELLHVTAASTDNLSHMLLLITLLMAPPHHPFMHLTLMAPPMLALPRVVHPPIQAWPQACCRLGEQQQLQSLAPRNSIIAQQQGQPGSQPTWLPTPVPWEVEEMEGVAGACFPTGPPGGIFRKSGMSNGDSGGDTGHVMMGGGTAAFSHHAGASSHIDHSGGGSLEGGRGLGGGGSGGSVGCYLRRLNVGDSVGQGSGGNGARVP
jgi:hypothetical protein